jgi:hypothetical protein
MSAAFKEMPVAMRGHPFGASQMALPGAPRPIGFTGWIDVQHNAGHFGPIRAFGVGVEETQIRHEMFMYDTVTMFGATSKEVFHWSKWALQTSAFG